MLELLDLSQLSHAQEDELNHPGLDHENRVDSLEELQGLP